MHVIIGLFYAVYPLSPQFVGSKFGGENLAKQHFFNDGGHLFACHYIVAVADETSQQRSTINLGMETAA